MSDTSEDPKYSVCPLGKCDHTIKTDIPEEAFDEFILLAGLNKQTKAEYLRDLIFEHVYGHVAMVRAKLKK